MLTGQREHSLAARLRQNAVRDDRQISKAAEEGRASGLADQPAALANQQTVGDLRVPEPRYPGIDRIEAAQGALRQFGLALIRPLVKPTKRERGVQDNRHRRPSTISASTAVEWGLVNRAVPLDRLAEETEALARQIADASPLTLGIGKAAFYAQIDLDQAHAYDHTREVMSLNALALDAREGIGAFLEKRSPCWQGQ